MLALDTLRANWHRRTSRHRHQLDNLPSRLYTAWASHAPRERPTLRTDRYTFVRATEGLLSFFQATATSPAPCALPSAAADTVWHAWLHWDRAGLASYCRRHYGRDVSHLDADSLDTGALARTLVLCRRQQGMRPEGPGLPDLFRLDATLRMPDGHGYFASPHGIIHAPLDSRGRCSRHARLHRELTPSALLDARLISEKAHAAVLRSLRTAHTPSIDLTGAWDAIGSLDDNGPPCAPASSDGATNSWTDGACDSGPGGGDSGTSCGGSSCGGSSGD